MCQFYLINYEHRNIHKNENQFIRKQLLKKDIIRAQLINIYEKVISIWNWFM